MIDWLRYHKLTDRDREGLLLEPYNDGKSDTAVNDAAFNVYHDPVPADKILIVESWTALMIADASDIIQAQFGVSVTLNLIIYFRALNVAYNEIFAAGQGTQTLSNKLPMVIMPNEVPTVRGQFLANGNHNMTSRIRGWLIPKGNVGSGFGGL